MSTSINRFIIAILFLTLVGGCGICPLWDSSTIEVTETCVLAPQLVDEATCSDEVIDLDSPESDYTIECPRRIYVVSSAPFDIATATATGLDFQIIKLTDTSYKLRLLHSTTDPSPRDFSLVNSMGELVLMTTVSAYCNMSGPPAEGPVIFEPIGPIGPVEESSLGLIERGTVLTVSHSPGGTFVSAIEPEMVRLDGQPLIGGVHDIGNGVTITVPNGLSAGRHVLEILDFTQTFVRVRATFELN
jgi:hypothetical protein